MNKSNTPPTTSSSTGSQAKRRTLYGVNITLAVAAAVLLVVFANWFVQWSYVRISPDAKRFVRYDLTATRRYSLSPQTRKVLAESDKQTAIVTLFRAENTQLQRVRDLIDEYELYGRDVSVKHINPTRDITQRELFFGDLSDRFSDDLTPLTEAIQDAMKAMGQAGQSMQTLAGPLNETLTNPAFPEGANKAFVRQVAGAFERYAQELDVVQPELQSLLEESLPAYAAVKADATETLNSLDTGLLSVAAAQFDRLVSAPDVPAAVKDAIVRVTEQIKQDQQLVADALAKLRLAESVQAYDEVRTSIATNEAVVVMTDDGVRVIPISEMYRQVTADQAERGGALESTFVGEERLTGAIASLRMGQPPMVVFVSGGQGSPMSDPRGYSYVQERLRAASFDVRSWSSQPGQSQFGQPIPPQPAPVPAEGQKAVWVVLPYAAPPQMNPMMMANDPRSQIATMLQERMAAGDAVMFLQTADPSARFGAQNPYAPIYEGWGVTPALDQIILQELQLPNGRTQANNQFPIDTWPTGFSVTDALAGQRGVVLQGNPIKLSDTAGVTHHALVQVDAPRLWGIDTSTPGGLQNAKYDAEAALDKPVVGVAAERAAEGEAPASRIAVVADPAWASDQITTHGTNPLFGSGPNMVRVPGTVATFPGNTELFINTTYWLAGLDELIAASARTQDIRRVSPMSRNSLVGHYVALIGGVPAVIFIAGIAVWAVRRRD